MSASIPVLPRSRCRSRGLRALSGWLVALYAALPCAPAFALTIVPTFTGTLSSSLQSDINAAIGVYETTFKGTKATIAIDFQGMASGLGESDSGYIASSYGTFRNALAHTTTTAVGARALAGLPAGTTNPLFGTAPPLRRLGWSRWDYWQGPAPRAQPDLYMTTANARALGLGAAPSVTVGGARYDGVVYINGAAGNYDYTAVAMHEIDEVLGLGSALDINDSWRTPRYAMPEDLYRYAANGARSFTYDARAVAFFSLGGKVTAGAPQFNQDPNGDYGDWCSAMPTSCKHFGVYVQNAFASEGRTVTLGEPEITALEAIGYDLSAGTGVAGNTGTATGAALRAARMAVVPLPASVWLTPLPLALIRARRRGAQGA